MRLERVVLGLGMVALQLSSGCGQPAKPHELTSPYAGIRWQGDELNTEIKACIARRVEKEEAYRAYVYCKCAYLGLAKISTHEDFIGDRQSVITAFESSSADEECAAWIERLVQVKAETTGHGLYRGVDLYWTDMYTGERYPYYEIMY